MNRGTLFTLPLKGSYIEGPKGERVELALEGGVYVIEAKFLKGFSRQV